MIWVFLEILAAVAIAVVIVWWTFPRKSRGREEDGGNRPPGNEEP